MQLLLEHNAWIHCAHHSKARLPHAPLPCRRCLRYGEQCGEDAASYFCQRRGYGTVASFAMETWRVPPATYLPAVGEMCITGVTIGGGCNSFSFIECAGAGRGAGGEGPCRLVTASQTAANGGGCLALACTLASIAQICLPGFHTHDQLPCFLIVACRPAGPPVHRPHCGRGAAGLVPALGLRLRPTRCPIFLRGAGGAGSLKSKVPFSLICRRRALPALLMLMYSVGGGAWPPD